MRLLGGVASGGVSSPEWCLGEEPLASEREGRMQVDERSRIRQEVEAYGVPMDDPLPGKIWDRKRTVDAAGRLETIAGVLRDSHWVGWETRHWLASEVDRVVHLLQDMAIGDYTVRP